MSPRFTSWWHSWNRDSGTPDCGYSSRQKLCGSSGCSGVCEGNAALAQLMEVLDRIEEQQLALLSSAAREQYLQAQDCYRECLRLQGDVLRTRPEELLGPNTLASVLLERV